MASWTVDLLHDRVVVTGGGSGIGQCVALSLAGAGASVYVMGRRAEPLAETARLAADFRGSVVPVRCDVRDDAAVAAAFREVEADGGPAGGLVHAAASPEYRPAREMTVDHFRDVIESTLVGAFNVIHRWGVALLDAEAPGAAVVYTSAIAHRGTPGAAHSSAAKAGIEGLMRTLAREWGPAGVRLNAVGPGFVPVERTSAMWESGPITEAVLDRTALGRLGEVHEAAGPAVYLLSSAAGYVTGEILVADGGFRLTPLVLPKLRFDAMPELGDA
jgi:NAD(P)-dependent dehydrogenase (short-subunit alcohol dehydrogenase family)